MANHTNRMAWGLAGVLGVVLVGALALLVSRPFEVKFGEWTLCGRVVQFFDDPWTSDPVPQGISHFDSPPSDALVERGWRVRLGNFGYIVGGYRLLWPPTRSGTGR
jgi:hypothetical protein